MVCILTLLGVKPHLLPVGRGFLEAMGAGLAVDQQDILFRCNIVSTDHEGKILSSCPTALDESQFSLISSKINQAAENLGMRLVHTEGYKLLLICKDLADSPYIPTQPPHQHIGEAITPPDHQRLQQFLQVADGVLQEQFKDKQYRATLWDYSAYRPLPDFNALWADQGAMVCGSVITAGIGRALNMHTIIPKGATGDTDTNLTAKAEECLRLIACYPHVYCHINGTDEASHRRSPIQKAEFLEKIDQQLLLPLIKRCPVGTVITICSDHGCSSVTGKHFCAPIPFISYTIQ